MTSTRLGVGVIGAGRVGPILAHALARAGHTLIGITPPFDDDRDRVGSILEGVTFVDPLEIIERSELVVLALPDDELPGFVEGVSRQKAWQHGQIVLHTSITHGLSVLDNARNLGVIPLALHPLMEFTGTSIDLARLSQSWCVVTAPAVAEPIASALAVEMGLEPLVVSEDNRGHVASAIALATSFSHTTIQEAASRLKEAGVINPGVVMHPLVTSSVENALRLYAGNETEIGGEE
ncbi:MAG: hypothetical protein RL247_559 [Actinomycetota bacterium]